MNNEIEMTIENQDQEIEFEMDTTFNYNNATNKPKINNVELKGNKSSADLGLQPAGEYITEETDPVFSASASAGITSNDISNWNNKSDFSGSYNDLTDKPTIPTNSDFTLDGLGEKSYNNLTDKPSIPSNTSDLTNNSGFITNAVNNLIYYTLKTSTGSLIDLEINSTTFVITLSLKDIDGNVISSDTIDLPLESVVVGGSYDSTNKKIVLTLENGNTVDIPVGDLVAGLQTELSSSNKLNADYIDDTNSGNKLVTTTEKNTWNAKLDSSALTDYVKNTDYATAQKGGTIKTMQYVNFEVTNGQPYASELTYQQYLNRSTAGFISRFTLENVITGKELVNKTYVDGLIGDINTALDLLNGEVI